MGKDKKYTIPIKIIFEGELYVKANCHPIAELIAKEQFNATIGECFDNSDGKIIDWKIDIHSCQTKIKKK
jgi:hypothetical protein